MKKLISGLLSVAVACACLVPSMKVPSASASDLPTRIINSGFENPYTGATSAQIPASTVEGWNTTAAEGLIEIFRENTNMYISGMTLSPRAGGQAAELNADEQSSIYQNISTVPGSFVRWGLSHRGRGGRDTMMLVIGPAQATAPTKNGKNGLDQFMKMGSFISENSELAAKIPTADGCSQEFVIYSPKFAESGSFVTGSDADFTLSKTDVNTEEWHVWMIKSNNDKWYDYGTNQSTDTSALGYNNIYEVPQNQDETIFAFTAYASGSGSLTVGNLLDNIDFGVMYNVTLNALTGGSGTVQDSNESSESLSVSYTGQSSDTKKYKDGSTVTISAIPDKDSDYGFAGAIINGQLYDYSIFNANSSNTVYTKDISVDEEQVAKLVFSRNGHIIYDPNGGQFLGTENQTDREFSYYTNGKDETDVPTSANATFTGWTLFNKDNGNTGVVIPADHTVTYNAETAASPTLTINYKDGEENKRVTMPATKESGIVLVAVYNYEQKAIAQVKEDDGSYRTSADGGSVMIHNDSRTATVSGSQRERVSSGAEGDSITVTAEANENYQFDGWFENQADTEPISKALQYTYTVAGSHALYARFSLKPEPDPTVAPTATPTQTPQGDPAACVRYNLKTGEFTPGFMEVKNNRPHSWASGSDNNDSNIVKGFDDVWYTVLDENTFAQTDDYIPDDLKEAALNVADMTSTQLARLSKDTQYQYGRIDSQAWKPSYVKRNKQGTLWMTPFITESLSNKGVTRDKYIWLAMGDTAGNITTVWVMDREAANLSNLNDNEDENDVVTTTEN